MSYLPALLRSTALGAATLFLVPTSFVAGTAAVATVSAVTIMTTTQAEAGRPRVRDHRGKICRPLPHRHCPR